MGLTYRGDSGKNNMPAESTAAGIIMSSQGTRKESSEATSAKPKVIKYWMRIPHVLNRWKGEQNVVPSPVSNGPKWTLEKEAICNPHAPLLKRHQPAPDMWSSDFSLIERCYSRAIGPHISKRWRDDQQNKSISAQGEANRFARTSCRRRCRR